jgi:hypothetical protein
MNNHPNNLFELAETSFKKLKKGMVYENNVIVGLTPPNRSLWCGNLEISPEIGFYGTVVVQNEKGVKTSLDAILCESYQ